MQLSVQVHWSHAMLSGVGTIDSHTLPDQVAFISNFKILTFNVLHKSHTSQDVMLVRRKASSLSAPNTPHPSLPPTPLRILASPRIGTVGALPGGGPTFAGTSDAAGAGAVGCLVAKLTASAATVVAAAAGESENYSMGAQVFHVARLLRYKVFLLQQVRMKSYRVSHTRKVILDFSAAFTVKHSN
jgi:hypothetical protein